MKIIIWITACCLSLSLFAQDVQQHSRKDATERLNKQLQLSPEQTAQVAVINEKFEIEMKQLRESERLNRDTRRATMEKIMDEKHQAIDQILTPKQREKHQAMLLKMKEARAEREQMNKNPDTRAAKMTEHMSQTLGLNNQQATQLKDINTQFVEQRHKLHENTQLTPEQKRPQMKAAHEAYEQKLKAVLTPQQYQQHLANQAQRKNDHQQGGRHEGKGKCTAPPLPPNAPPPPKAPNDYR